ncbi:6-phosphogluconolactonase [Halopseudomonas xinjiangensis]|uniref:6-phosphogluconolactonase n=1 Tax=Halopseudomonas xinjiangensis TaxID=487184 RepID=A0A1H1N3E6_9GAMM|nr:6-phosphogluconolactonase [Halopseudomonas xinjiangensis]SDR93504.1 6-phosphogluconolactonase [Halopseudomonas xinjiangensis]
MSTPLGELARANGLHLHDAASPAEQARLMADFVLEALARALHERGHASLAVSGGRSPAAFFKRLNESELDWEEVTLTLADERWVPQDDPESNAGLVQRSMPNVFARAHWVPLYRGLDPHKDAAAVSTDIERLLPLDVLVLGVGADGHTASLFPVGDHLLENLRSDAPALCQAVPAADQRLPRLTLTGAVLQRARVRLLQVNGGEKQAVVARAFNAEPREMPVAAFLQPPMDIFYAPNHEEPHEPG